MKIAIGRTIAAILTVLVVASAPEVKPLNRGFTPVSNFFDDRPTCLFAER